MGSNRPSHSVKILQMVASQLAWWQRALGPSGALPAPLSLSSGWAVASEPSHGRCIPFLGVTTPSLGSSIHPTACRVDFFFTPTSKMKWSSGGGEAGVANRPDIECQLLLTSRGCPENLVQKDPPVISRLKGKSTGARASGMCRQNSL